MGKNIVVIAIEAGDTIPENLGCKIQRPLPICAGLTVRFCDDRHRPLYRSLKYGLRSVDACEHRAQHLSPTEDHRDDVLLVAANR